MELNITKDLFIETDVGDHLNCAICFQILIDPVRDQCQGTPHSFCRACITEWLGERQICPISKVRLILTTLQDDLAKRQELDELTIRCSNYARKCSWTGKLADFAAHLTACPKRIYFAKTQTAEANDEGMNEFAYSMSDEVAQKSDLELDSIIMDFTADVTASPLMLEYHGLSSIQLVWRHQGNHKEELVYGQRANTGIFTIDPSNVERREVFRVEPGQSIEHILLYKSEHGFSVVGFKLRGVQEAQLFGYLNRKSEKGSMTLEIPEGGNLIGVFGFTNWGISKLGFHVLVAFDQ